MSIAKIKLSSIMFTDIVGYSKKIQKDQALTLAALEDHNKIVQKNIESHQGRVVKFTGDGYMAEFIYNLASEENSWEGTFSIMINAPVLEVSNPIVYVSEPERNTGLSKVNVVAVEPSVDVVISLAFLVTVLNGKIV